MYLGISEVHNTTPCVFSKSLLNVYIIFYTKCSNLLFKFLNRCSYAEDVKQSGCVREELDLEAKMLEVRKW